VQFHDSETFIANNEQLIKDFETKIMARYKSNDRSMEDILLKQGKELYDKIKIENDTIRDLDKYTSSLTDQLDVIFGFTSNKQKRDKIEDDIIQQIPTQITQQSDKIEDDIIQQIPIQITQQSDKIEDDIIQQIPTQITQQSVKSGKLPMYLCIK